MAVMTNTELVAKLQNVVDNYKTLYVMGCFGAPLTGANVSRYCTNHSYNKAAARTAMIKAAADKTPPIFGFDCVCLIKGILWGWTGDGGKTYGGATYTANGVPDISADQMITKCTSLSTDFSKIEVGEAVWLSGHIGVYIGGGKVIECTPSWANCVQVTACTNIGSISGLNGRKWTQHGKLPYVSYTGVADNSGGSNGTGTDTGGTNSSIGKGNVVDFTGSKHYSSSTATSGYTCKPGKAKVTDTAPGAANPYHLIAESGGGSNVYGWVKAADIVTSQTSETKHTVVKGDTLWGLAVKYLGNGTRYTEIKTLNGLTSDTIVVGQVLKIPAK